MRKTEYELRTELIEAMESLGNVELMVKNTLELEGLEVEMLEVDMHILKGRYAIAIETLEEIIKFGNQTKI